MSVQNKNTRIINSIGTNLKIARLDTEEGLSIKEVSRRTGISASYIGELERGEKHNPTIDTLVKLCNFYDVEIDWLFYEMV